MSGICAGRRAEAHQVDKNLCSCIMAQVSEIIIQSCKSPTFLNHTVLEKFSLAGVLLFEAQFEKIAIGRREKIITCGNIRLTSPSPVYGTLAQATMMTRTSPTRSCRTFPTGVPPPPRSTAAAGSSGTAARRTGNTLRSAPRRPPGCSWWAMATCSRTRTTTPTWRAGSWRRA